MAVARAARCCSCSRPTATRTAVSPPALVRACPVVARVASRLDERQARRVHLCTPPQAAQVDAAPSAADPPPMDNTAVIATLTDKLLTLETQLADMFESGRPMPKAAVVNAVREEISALKEQLARLMQGLPPLPPPTPAPAAGASPAAGSGSAAGGSTPAESLQEMNMLEKARLLLEGVSLRKMPEVDALTDAEYSVRLAMLEAENDRLRVKARALLLRQQALEEQAERHAVPRRAPAAHKEPAAAAPGGGGAVYALADAAAAAAAAPGAAGVPKA